MPNYQDWLKNMKASGLSLTDADYQRAMTDRNYANALGSSAYDYANAKTPEAAALAQVNATALSDKQQYQLDQLQPGGGTASSFGDIYKRTPGQTSPTTDFSSIGKTQDLIAGVPSPFTQMRTATPNIGTPPALMQGRTAAQNVGTPPALMQGRTASPSYAQNQMQTMQNTASPSYAQDFSNFQTATPNISEQPDYSGMLDYAATATPSAAWDGYDAWRQRVTDSGYYFSDDDMQRAQNDADFAEKIFRAKEGYAQAQAAGDEAMMQYWHQYAEDARKPYQYSGGQHGDEYLPWGNEPVQEPTRPVYDPTNVPDRPTYDPTAAGDMPTYDPESAGERPTYEIDPQTKQMIDDIIAKIVGWEDYESPYADQIRTELEKILGYGDYSSPYAKEISDLVTAITGRDPFSYDLETDPSWQAYKKQYTREGRRASEDALAQAAAMTGGVPSSYANTAAQQAGNYYMTQMTDKIPELYQLAYGRYADEGNRMLNNLSAIRGLDQDAYGRYADTYNRYANNLGILQGLDATEYGRYGDKFNRTLTGLDAVRALENDQYNRYRDTVGDWENDRNFGYNRWRDEVGDWRDNRNFDYDRWRDEVGDWRNDRDTDYNRYLDALDQWYNDRAYDDSRADTEYERKWNEAITAAKYGDYSKLQELGITPDMAMLMGGSGGGGGSGRGGSTGGNASQQTTESTDTGLRLPQSEFNRIYQEAQQDPAAARDALTKYWSYLTDFQKHMLALRAGIDADSLFAGGGASNIGPDAFADMFNLLSPPEETGTGNAAGQTGFSSAMSALLQYGPDYAKNYIKQHYPEMGYGSATEAQTAWEMYLTENGYGQTTKGSSLDYSPDEGVFTWNGKQYSDINAMLEAMDRAGLSIGDQMALANKLRMYGFDVY